MSDTSKGESARASREARDAVIARPRGSKGRAVDDALRRYLNAATSEELHRLREDSAEQEQEQKHKEKGPSQPR